MSWFTSRYTASLEQQVAELKQSVASLKSDLAFEREQVSQLTLKLVESVQALADASGKAGTPDKDKEKKVPQLGNWLKTRAALESQDHVVREVEPDKEKSANGSR